MSPGLSSDSSVFWLQPVTGFRASTLQGKRHVVNLPERPVQAPLSDAILAGDTLYLSGRIGLDPKTGKPPAEIEQDIRVLLDGANSTLGAAGMTMDDLVYVQVSCSDLARYDKFSGIYRGYFATNYPARSALRGEAAPIQ